MRGGRRAAVPVGFLVFLAATAWQTPADPARAAVADWVPTAPISTARNNGAAIVLDGPPCRASAPPAWCGKVLVAGGHNNGALRASELYDPVAAAWASTGAMAVARHRPSLVPLPGGRVLAVAGGDGGRAEVYDPGPGTWSPTGPMQTTNRSGGPYRITATALADGRVLVAGGYVASASTALAEVYDPGTNAWSPTGSMINGRHRHSAVLLADGRALVAGGEHTIPLDDPPGTDPAAESAEIYDPDTGTWAGVAAPPLARDSMSAVLLPDGRALFAAGLDNSDVNRGTPPTGTMTYNPGGTWSTGAVSVTLDQDATLHRLPDGRVLAAPDHADTYPIPATQILDPASGTWTAFGVPAKSRRYVTVAVLPCRSSGGRVLAAGGLGPSGGTEAQASAELFTGIPTVQQVSPPVVSTAGGADVTIRGIGLAPRGSGSVSVSFGAASVIGTPNADGTEVTAKAPAVSAEGPVDVGVTVGGVKAERCTTAPFVYAAGPRIDAVSPDRGPATGGQRVTIAGTGMGGTVTLDGQAVPGATVTAGGISFDTPPHDPGPVTLAVSNGVGEATAQYTYLPAVKGVSPSTGPPEGGTPLTITGKGLATATEVRVGDKVAELVARADGEVSVRTPAHDPGKVTVTVRTDKGQAVPLAVGADQFEYVASALPPANPSGVGTTAAAGPAGGGTGGGGSQLPLGGGGTGGGGSSAGGLTTDPSPAATTLTPDPVGGGLAAGGSTTGSPVAATAPAPDPVGGGLASGIVPGPSPVASPSAAPVAPPSPPSASPVAQGSAPGPAGAGLPGGGGDNSQGAPRYAMVGQQQAGIPLAIALAGGVMLMALFGGLVVAARPPAAGGASPALGAPRPQGAY